MGLGGSNTRHLFATADGRPSRRSRAISVFDRSMDSYLPVPSTWNDRRDFVMWDVLAPQAGKYAVEASYACDDDSAGSVVELAHSDRPNAKTSAKITGTGGWDSYADITLGTIELPAGAHTLTFKATSVPSGIITTGPTTTPTRAVMNLKEIRLKPQP